MEVTLLEATDDPEDLVCKAARNDYSDEFVGGQSLEATMETVEGDSLEAKKETLIGHLLEHGHFGPFEHPQITFAVEGVSRSCMAQITRHRHVSFDVQSMRYVSFDEVDPDDVREGEMVVVPPSATDPDWVGRNQKADADEADVEKREEIFRNTVADAVESYQELLDLGMPPEDARFVLPIGTKVNMVMSMNVRMLMHVADMRAAADAQWEIRNMTEDLLDIAADWCPITFDHYEREMKNRKNRLAP
ncbi:FAD-dependent thymidylate synthase [Haloarcula nitratireducens]|uniref:Flavin-dependent thymidylate synthase n=1 Tax=Haloarcula nitratireducens TaxID=2487749 RepID=A0AAW4P8S0_9EURY|nr:FAD-dependent thymidylate synthase [Halomicroarcula nitratireducens]MBX0294203.1 FAD-dependent thymidylate synthase [Halomicroarcula nitratireducens]